MREKITAAAADEILKPKFQIFISIKSAYKSMDHKMLIYSLSYMVETKRVKMELEPIINVNHGTMYKVRCFYNIIGDCKSYEIELIEYAIENAYAKEDCE